MEAKTSSKELERIQAVQEMSWTVLIEGHTEDFVKFIVPSASSSRPPYIVKWVQKNIPDPEANNWHCSCDDYKYRNESHLGYKCKHVQSVVEFLKRVSAS